MRENFREEILRKTLKSRHMSSVVQTPAIPKTRTPNVAAAIFALAMGGVGIGVTEFTMMGLLKEVEQGLSISTPEAGHLISAYALGVVVGAPLLAAVGARLPRKHLALGLMLFFTLANLLSYIAPDYGMMLVSRFAAGLPHGAFFGVAAVIAASLVPPTRRGWAISMVMAGLSVSNVVGVPVATWVGQTFGWRLLFLLVGGIGLLTLFLLWRFVPFQAAHPDASIRRELGALRRVQVWLAILIGVVGFGGFFATYTYIAHTMTLVAGIPGGLLPVVVALYGLGMVAGTVIGGRLADRSVMGTLYWVLPGIAVALVVYAVAAHWQWSALVMVFVVGASGSLLIPALQTRLLDASPDAPSLASSLNHAALNVANALGAFLGGVVIAWGWGFVAPALVGAVLAILGLAVAVLSGFLERRKPLAT
jgi:DHA1 family inner membrane transport protein